MEKLSWKDISMPFIMSLIANLVSINLLAFKIINLTIAIFILILSLMGVGMIGLQLKTNKAEEELTELKVELSQKAKNLEEKLKIYERLAVLEVKLNNLEKRGKNG